MIFQRGLRIGTFKKAHEICRKVFGDNHRGEDVTLLNGVFGFLPVHELPAQLVIVMQLVNHLPANV